MFIETKFTSEKYGLQALNLENTQDDASIVGRLRLLVGLSRKSKNEKKYFKDDNNLELLRNDLSKNFQKVLDFLICQGSGRRSFYFSQTKIADIIGCDRVTVQRATAYFESKGLLIKYRKDTWSVCLFIMSNKIYQYARGFKYKFLSLAAFLKGLWDNLQDKNVTPLRRRNVVILPRKSIVVDNQSRTEVKRGNFLTKREDMEISPPNITPTLREITDRIGLTKLGQLKLLVIPDDILSSVWSHFKKQSGVNKPFEWLLANCLRRCENLNVVINWELFYLSVKRYGLVDNKKYVHDKPIIKAQSIESRRSVDNIIRPHQDKKEPHPAFAVYFTKAMENGSRS